MTRLRIALVALALTIGVTGSLTACGSHHAAPANTCAGDHDHDCPAGEPDHD